MLYVAFASSLFVLVQQLLTSSIVLWKVLVGVRRRGNKSS